VYIYIYKRKEKIKKARKMLLDHKSHGFIDYLTLKWRKTLGRRLGVQIVVLYYYFFFSQKATKAESLGNESLALKKETKHRLRELMHLFVGEEETK
jgi:hypothetical protein